MVAADHLIRPLRGKGNDGHLEETTCSEETCDEQTRESHSHPDFGDGRRGVCLSGVRPHVRSRRRIGRASQSRTRRRGSLGTGNEAPRTRWTAIEREERLGREEHDSHVDSLTQTGKPRWNRPRFVADDPLPRRNAGPRGSAPGSERLARRSGAPFANALKHSVVRAARRAISSARITAAQRWKRPRNGERVERFLERNPCPFAIPPRRSGQIAVSLCSLL
jgi:hypothetical protein